MHPRQVPIWQSLNPREPFPRASIQGSQSRRNGWSACDLDKPRQAGSYQKEAREEQGWAWSWETRWLGRPVTAEVTKQSKAGLGCGPVCSPEGDVPGWECSARAEAVRERAWPAQGRAAGRGLGTRAGVAREAAGSRPHEAEPGMVPKEKASE